MPNTNGTTNANVIAQKALKSLLARLPILKAIATDFSKENAKFNAAVIVHAVTAAEAANFNPLTGYVPQARVQVDIPVTINKHKHHTYEVTVQEASSSSVDLIQRYADTAAYSIGAAVIGDLCALVKAAAFANKTVKGLGAGGDAFDRKAAVSVGTQLSKRGVPGFGRFLMLNPDYYGSLANDNAMLQIMLMAGAEAAKSGILPEVHGMLPMEYVNLPDNGEDLVGFAGINSGLAIATRIPDDPGEGQGNVRISTVSDPDTGLALQVREWYEATLASYRRAYTLMYGVAAGLGDAVQRITSK